MDTSASAPSSADPTASLQAKLASRELVRYLANSLVKARSGVSDSANKDQINLDLTVVAGKIERFAESNSRVHVSVKQNSNATQVSPTVELSFSLLEGSDANMVDAKIKDAVREVLNIASAVSPAFKETAYGLRKSADGSRDEYFFKIPVRSFRWVLRPPLIVSTCIAACCA